MRSRARCAAERGVRRRAAEILREARNVFEARADLLRVEVDGEPAEADDVEASAGGEADGISHREDAGGPTSRDRAAFR